MTVDYKVVPLLSWNSTYKNETNHDSDRGGMVLACFSISKVNIEKSFNPKQEKLCNRKRTFFVSQKTNIQKSNFKNTSGSMLIDNHI